MSETKTIDLEALGLITGEGMQNPTAEDISRWEALSDEEKKAAIIAAMDEAEAEGLAPKQTMAEILAEARATPSP